MSRVASGPATEKPRRIVDEALLDRFRAMRNCEHCGKPCRPHPHHVKSRGAGGGDTTGNVIAMAPDCHDAVHRGQISRETLRAIIARRPEGFLT